MTTTAETATRRFPLPAPINLRTSLGPLWYGPRDPSTRLDHDRLQRAVLTPDGPGTIELVLTGGHGFASGWGPGREWLLEQAPALAGACDDDSGFVAQHRAVARAARAAPGLRVPATGTVWDVLVPTVLAQKVTGLEAARSWLRMLRRWGEPAPGPLGLNLPPRPERVAEVRSWEFHDVGVEQKRAATIHRAALVHDRLEAITAMSAAAAYRRLTSVRGVGPWTAALVIRAANGDPDAVEVGDFHVKHHVCWNLAGQPRGDDVRMLELLEPYRGHRGRVVRLLVESAPRAPAFGPRHAVRDIRGL